MSKEETNTPIEQLAVVMTAYIKAATEIDQRRAKADEQRAKEAKELDERRAKEAKELDERRAKEAKELDERRAKEARELDERRAKADEKRAKAAEKREKAAEKREKAAEKREKAAEKREKAAEQRSKKTAEDTNTLKKQVDKVSRQMEETNIRYGSTARNTGRVTEETFFQALKSQKCVGNTTFKSIEHNIHCKDGKPNGRSAELDIVMHNGTYSLIIEVKYLCHLNDVEKFEEKMHTAYAYISKKFNNRKLLFGMAANIFNKNAADYAHEHGMITFHPDGQKVRTDIPAHTQLHPDTSA